MLYSGDMNVDEVRRLYNDEHLGAREIGERLHKTVWQVIKFMKKNGIKRRKCNETLRYVISRQPKSFKKKTILTNEETYLYQAGLMIYWGEGVKVRGTTVDLANSDPNMVKIFLSVLRNIYRVNEARLRVLLYCYANQNVEDLKRYWSNLLKIPLNQFIKPYVRSDYKVEKTNKMPFGVAHVRYNDTKLHWEITQDIAIMVSRLTSSWGGRVDKYTGL